MNRRTAALLSAVVVGSLSLTGCGAMKSATQVRGLVVEREETMTKDGIVYSLEIATDAKTIRYVRVHKKTKKSEVNVKASVYNSCSLKEMYPACK